MEISQEDPDPDDPDASNVYDFNDGEDPTQTQTHPTQDRKSVV